MATPEDLRMFEAKKGEVKFDPTRDPRGTHAGPFHSLCSVTDHCSSLWKLSAALKQFV